MRDTLIATHRGDEGPVVGPRVLVVVEREQARSVAIPESGTLTVGRDATCDVVLDDPRVSREHVRLHTGDGVEVEELGSANGTIVSGATVAPNQRVPLRPGQSIEIGDTLLVLQVGRVIQRRGRLMSHARFEAELEAACRTAGPRSPLAVLRIRVEGEVSPDDVRAILTAPLGGRDAIGAFAPGQYEVMLLDAALGRAEAVADDVEAAFLAAGAPVRIGLACLPRNGRDAQVLLAAASEALTDDDGDAPVVTSPVMGDVYRMVERVAAGRISVLLTGETGVGKELVAEALHRSSPRADAPFVRTSCAAFTESVVESELFGHERGAFTGAEQRRLGLLESASGGTVFLDELGELPLATQATLLRAIEQREIVRVGGITPVAIDVRFVAATNRDLLLDVENGRFRRDLYYRLAGVTVTIPPLRERTEEIIPLAHHFLARFARELAKPPPALSEEAAELLLAYAWPGNVRELRNVMERAVLLAEGGRVEVQHVPSETLGVRWTSGAPKAPASAEDSRKARVVRVLAETGWNQTRAAEQLGVSRRTLTKWLNAWPEVPRPKRGA